MAIALLLGPAANPAAAAVPSVLVLEQETFSWPAPQEFLGSLRAGLRQLGTGALVYEESLDLTRFDAPGYRANLRRWLREKYHGRPVDVVVAAGLQTVHFVLAARAEIWPDAAIVAASLDAATLESVRASGPVTGRPRPVPVEPTLDLALALLPQTRAVTVVAGLAAEPYLVDRVAAVRAAADRRGLTTVALVGLPMNELRQQLGALPADTIVYYGGVLRDGAGEIFVPRDALTLVTQSASRPVFSDVKTHLGAGIVGGFLLDSGRHGREIAELVAQILGGAAPATLHPPASEAAGHAVDARQIERWGLDETRLPAATEISFRDPSPWQRYRSWVVAGVVVSGIQTLLISGLLVERRERRRAEQAGQQTMLQLVHLNRVAALGEMSAALAHEINQPLTAILGNAQAARRLLDAEQPDLAEIRASLDDIVEADDRAAGIINGLRSLLRRGPTRVEPVALAGLIGATFQLVETIARKRDTTLELDLAPDLPPVAGDPIQLQQVLINLLLNAIDAAADGAEPRRVNVKTEYIGPGVVEIRVADSGPGIRPGEHERIFEPFVSTKSEGLGVGLGICRTIVKAHGGRLWADTSANDGGVLRCRLPVIEEIAA